MDEQTRQMLERVESKIDEIYRVLYQGNGGASITTRLDRLERRALQEGKWGGRLWDVGKMLIAALIASVMTVFGAGAL